MAIAHVGNLANVNINSGGTGYSITLASGSSAGQFLLLGIVVANGSATLSSVSDSPRSNSWTVLTGGQLAGTTTDLMWAAAYVATPHSAGDVIAATFSGSVGAPMAAFVEAYSGVASSSYVDVQATPTTSSTGTTLAVGPTAALAGQNEMMVSALALRAAPTTSVTEPTGYTKRVTAGYNSGATNTSRTIVLADKILTTDTAAQSATWTNGTSGLGRVAGLVALKASAGSPPVASAGVDATKSGGTNAALDGSGTTGATSYSWACVSSTGGSTSDPTFISSSLTQSPTVKWPNKAATYTMRLTATNADGSSSDDVVITTTQTFLLRKISSTEMVVPAIKRKASGGSLVDYVVDVSAPVLPSTGIFVDPTSGLNTNTGAIDSPYQTLAKALQVAADGDTVWLKSGSYTVSSVTGATSRTDYCTVKPYPGASITMASGWNLGRTGSNNGVAQCKYVHFDGLTLDNSLIIGWGCSFIKLTNCDLQYVNIEDGVSDVTIEDNTILRPTNTTTTAIYFASDATSNTISNVYIRRNTITAGQAYINLRKFNNVVIEDNVLSGVNPNTVGQHCDGIRTFGGGSDLYIRRNHITGDGSLLFFKDGATSNVVIENNFVGTAATHNAVSFYSVTGLRFVNNTVADKVVFGSGTTNSDAIVANNVILGNLETAGSTTTFTYKNYNIVTGTNASAGANDTTTSPTFVSGTDYHLDAGDTRAKDTGVSYPVGGFTPASDLDLDGTTRAGTMDRGCYTA